MLTLAIDSATEACSAALFENGEMIAGACRMLGKQEVDTLKKLIGI